ncbi:hypothetical protein [Dyadobacter sp.]|uniref:hypothetical protein n=1 Tax=Dyadobacter sp. TaxID=1914288 RepID=UPI003F711D58
MHIRYNIQERVVNALVKLREEKHQAGFPFMISDSASLPSNQAYMEYKNGRVDVVEFSGDFKDYHLVRALSDEEIKTFREKYRLY